MSTEIVAALEVKYGHGTFYELSSGLDKIHKSETGEIIGAQSEAESIVSELNICPIGFEILPETYQTYEYGSVTIAIKCFKERPNA